MYIYIYIYMCVCVCVCMFVCAHPRVCMYMCVCVCEGDVSEAELERPMTQYAAEGLQ